VQQLFWALAAKCGLVFPWRRRNRLFVLKTDYDYDDDDEDDGRGLRPTSLDIDLQ